jgi:biotin carboxylase
MYVYTYIYMYIQEYITGQEYAVDTVTKDGHTKVVALWKYSKVPVNGAPFVYQCTELVSSSGKLESEVCDYCVDVLDALGLQWGPTHTEIMACADGPRLIEVNARFHAANTYPLVTSCIGYDALTATLDSFFDPASFDALPERPEDLLSHGLILHLISSKAGKVSNINHEDEIVSMPSVLKMSVEPSVGKPYLFICIYTYLYICIYMY